MKKIFWTILLSPFLVCDPQAGITSYQITGLSPTMVSTDAETNGSIKYDMASTPAGSYSIQVKACQEPWGCSEATPFEFTKPSLQAPVDVHLGK
jgi:hypothetical protein